MVNWKSFKDFYLTKALKRTTKNGKLPEFEDFLLLGGGEIFNLLRFRM